MDTIIAIAGSALAAFATGFVGWLAHSYRRQMKFRLADTRRDAYASLWEMTGLAAPTRLDGSGPGGHLRPTERWQIWKAMTDWYYASGNGMLLDDTSKSVYLAVKHNLVCRTRELRPDALADLVCEDLGRTGQEDALDEVVVRGILSIKQLSLLRTQLKSDLRIYGQTYSEVLHRHEVVFLRGTGVRLESRAWASASKWYWSGMGGEPIDSPWNPRMLLEEQHPVDDLVPNTSELALARSSATPESSTCALKHQPGGAIFV